MEFIKTFFSLLFVIIFSVCFSQFPKDILSTYKVKTCTIQNGGSITYFNEYNRNGEKIINGRINSSGFCSYKSYNSYYNDLLTDTKEVYFSSETDSTITFSHYEYNSNEKLVYEERYSSNTNDTANIEYTYTYNIDSSLITEKAIANNKLWYEREVEIDNKYVKSEIDNSTDCNFNRKSNTEYDKNGNVKINYFYYGVFLISKEEYKYNKNNLKIKKTKTSYLPNEKQEISDIVISTYDYYSNDLLKSISNQKNQKTTIEEYHYTFFEEN